MTSDGMQAIAARQILAFYDTIPAMDQQAFTAGLVEMLSNYPPAVLQRAVSPSRGLPAYVSYPNLAKFRELLDEWAEIFWEERAKKNQRLAKPEAVKRLEPRRLDNPPQGHFANVHIPNDHVRYESLCEWAKTADLKWWKYGNSSVGKPGIWIPLDVWHGDAPLGFMTVGAAVPQMD